MGSTSDTASETSQNDPTTPPTIPTDEVASRLEDAGYDITYQPGGDTPRNIKGEAIAFIAVHISQKSEAQNLQALLDDIDPSSSHRIISPENITALPDWPDPSELSHKTSARPVYVVRSPQASVSSGAIARERASFL